MSQQPSPYGDHQPADLATLRDLHRRTQAAEAEVHALRRQVDHARRQWGEAVADRNRYQGWARQGKSLNKALTAAIRAHLDARDRCDPVAEHATRKALDTLLAGPLEGS